MDIGSRITKREGPLYLAISAAIAEDITLGKLQAGYKLPTHRDLAYQTNVTVGTVARAYAELAKRGLIVGEVGRGTYVVNSEAEEADTNHLMVPESNTTDGIIDLTLNLSASSKFDELFRRSFQSAAMASANTLLRYQPAGGISSHRTAAAQWMAHSGFSADPHNTVVCNGGQHAIFLSLMALTRHGDTLVTEPLTYPGASAAARQLGLAVVGAHTDSEGIQPDALRELCRTRHPKVLYTMPVLQNPTTVTTSERRLQEIARIAREYELWIIEDDVYGFLSVDRPPPLVQFAPERTIYLTSVSKSMAPGLRVGFLHVPSVVLPTFQDLLAMTNWMTSPLLSELVSTWICSGQAEELVDWHREQAAIRKSIAERWLSPHLRTGRQPSYHLWLPLPETWRMDSFAVAALREGVKVITADAFAVKRDYAPHAVRLCLGSPQSLAQLELAMTSLAKLINSPPEKRITLEMGI